jgi:Protein of unknown function (DUF3592)
LFLVIAYREWNTDYKIMHSGQVAEATVIGTYRKPRRTGETMTYSEAPIVTFLGPKDTVVTFYATLFTTPCQYQIGQRVNIWYLPENPQKATLGGKEAWLLPMIFGLFGIAMCLVFYPICIRIIWRYYASSA